MPRSGTDSRLIVTPFIMADLVQYQDGSIISRAFLDKDAGTITVFAFDAGQNLSEHTVPYDAVVQILDGTGIVVIKGERIEVAAGQSIIMPANIPHSVKADARFKMVLIMIRA